MSSKRKAESQSSERESKQVGTKVEASSFNDVLPHIFEFVFAAYEMREQEIEIEQEDNDYENENNSSDDEPAKKTTTKSEVSETSASSTPVLPLLPPGKQYLNLALVSKKWQEILKQEKFVKMTIRGILNDLYDFSDLVEGGAYMDRLNDQCSESEPVNEIFTEPFAKYFTKTEFKLALFTSPDMELNVNPNMVENISDLKELLEIYRNTYALSVFCNKHKLQWSSETDFLVVPCVFYFPNNTFGAEEFGRSIYLHPKLLLKKDYFFEEKYKNSEEIVSGFIVQEDKKLAKKLSELIDRTVKATEGGVYRYQYCYYDKMDLTTKPVFVVNRRGNYVSGLFTLAVET